MTSNADAVLIGFIVTVTVVGLLATVSLVVFVCFKWKQFIKRREGARQQNHGHNHRRHHSRRRRGRAHNNNIIMIQESSQQCPVQITEPPAYDSIDEPPPPYSLVDNQQLHHPRMNDLVEQRIRSDSINSTSRLVHASINQLRVNELPESRVRSDSINSNSFRVNALPATNPGSVVPATPSESLRNGRISSNQIMLSHLNTPHATPLSSRRGSRRSSRRGSRFVESTSTHEHVFREDETVNSNSFLSGHFSHNLMTESRSRRQGSEGD